MNGENQMKVNQFILVACAVLGLAGCASSTGGASFERGETRRAMTVEYGTVDAVRFVRIEGTRSLVGPVAGAAVGGLAGSAVGGGTGRSIATVLGAVAGGAAGSAIENRATSMPGVEVTVRLQNGQLISIVQEDEGDNFRPGDWVRVIRDGSTARVAR